MAGRKRSRILIAVALIILGLAAYGGYMVWQVRKTTENVRKVTDTVEKYATKENLDKAGKAAKKAAKSAKEGYSRIRSRLGVLKDKASRAYRKARKEWNKPLHDSPEAVPKRKRIPVLTDAGLKWGNIDDFE